MSRRLIAFLATSAVTLFSGVAAARQPAPVVEQQRAASRVLAQCAQDFTGGYRDMLTRFGLRWEPYARPVAQVAVQRARADHLVIRCAGETLLTGGGYRDVLLRFEADRPQPLMARAGR